MDTHLDPEIEYYALKLSKIRHKKYEAYVINRIVHQLDDREIEFRTQQLVRTSEGRYLIDLYFPQFKLAIEIDEPYHSKSHQVASDVKRSQAIVESSEIGTPVRVKVAGVTIAMLNQTIDSLIDRIRKLKEDGIKQGHFEPFVYGRDSDPDYWLKQGQMDVNSLARLRTHVAVARLFGKHYGGHQRAVIKLNDEFQVWFPKLYDNNDWENDLSADGKTITMKKTSEGKYENNGELSGNIFVFAHHNDELGQVFYGFKGVFKEKLRTDQKVIFYRIHDGVKFDGEGLYEGFDL